MMNRDSVRILSGLRELSRRPNELVSGKVVVGSVDIEGNTMSVVLSGSGKIIDNVLLKATGDGPDGVITIPEEGTDVVVGSIDGPGQWTMIQASKVARWQVKMDDRSVVVSTESIDINSGTAHIKLGEKISVSVGAENLYSLLYDILDAIKLITVTTSSGPSSVPVNVLAFDAILLRLNNLLAS